MQKSSNADLSTQAVGLGVDGDMSDYDDIISRMLRHLIKNEACPAEWAAVSRVAKNRPPSLRAFDQIPMRDEDLLCQIKLMMPYLANRSIAFVGDHDSAGLLLGVLSRDLVALRPTRITLLDFDERLLCRALDFASVEGFADILDVALYNVFDPVPQHLLGQFDWFYTNPPYGASNCGESARLFITRGCELAKVESARACIILPHDLDREWTRTAMSATQAFLSNFGWTVKEKLNAMHRYHLDDDRELASSVVIVQKDPLIAGLTTQMPYAGRQVAFGEIRHFYGRGTSAPYPHYVLKSGVQDFHSHEEKQ